MPSTLKQKAVSGMVWTALQKYSIIFIQFVSGIILARLLTPYDYGCIGMLTIFMMLAQTFIDSGFGSALIQKKKPTQIDYSSIFWWNIGMAVIMYALLYVSAPAIARFYDIPLLSKVLRIQGLVLFLYAFNIIQQNQLQKQLQFKVLSIVSIVTSFVSLGITILMAYKGFGVWALVAQNLFTAAIPAISFWCFIKWRPSWTFSWKSFKELFGFGFFMFLTSILNQFGQQLQGLLIGKVFNPSTMGYYSKAHSTEKLASQSISQVMTQVTYPLYAEVQNDKVMLGNMIKRLTMTLSYVSFPLLFLSLLLAKPIFILLYSEKWLPSVPYFQALCIGGLAYSLQSVNTQSIAAIGKSRAMFWWTVLKRSVGISCIVIGLSLFGMKGLLVAVVFGMWFSFFVNISLVSRHIGYKWWRQLLDIMPVFIVSLIATAVSYFVESVIHLPIYTDALVKLVVFAVIYVGWSVVFKPEAFLYTKGVVVPMISKLRRGKQ